MATIIKQTETGIYYIVCLLLMAILSMQTSQCAFKFFEAPTYVENHIVEQNEGLFPSTTICSSPSGFKEDVLKVYKSTAIN